MRLAKGIAARNRTAHDGTVVCVIEVAAEVGSVLDDGRVGKSAAGDDCQVTTLATQ